MYQYEQFLNRNQINESELPSSILKAIDKLHELDYELDEETDDAEIKAITVKIKALDVKLLEEITDWADDETDEDLPEDKVKEQILTAFHKNGLSKIKLAQLKVAGYKYPSSSKWHEKIGDYQLKKSLYSDFATLTKA